MAGQCSASQGLVIIMFMSPGAVVMESIIIMRLVMIMNTITIMKKRAALLRLNRMFFRKTIFLPRETEDILRPGIFLRLIS